MKGQTAMTFESSQSANPVPDPSFQESNAVMQKMESNCRPKSTLRPAKDTAFIDEISKLLQSFENKIDQKIIVGARKK